MEKSILEKTRKDKEMTESQEAMSDEEMVSKQHEEADSATGYNDKKVQNTPLASKPESSTDENITKEQQTVAPHDTSETDLTQKESSTPKKNPAEVFQELKSVVVGMDIKLDEIQKFVHIAKDKLLNESEEYIEKGKFSVLESLYELHDMLFRKVMAMEAGEVEPDSFVVQLMEYVQEIIRKHGVDIIIPQPGERFDMNYMESLRSLPAKFWRNPDTVANVEKCGYSRQTSTGGKQVIRPARVIVYKKQKGDQA